MFKKLTYFFVASAILLGAIYFYLRSNRSLTEIKSSSVYESSDVSIIPVSSYVLKKPASLKPTPNTRSPNSSDKEQYFLNCWENLSKELEKTCSLDCTKKSLAKKSAVFKDMLQGGWFNRDKPLPVKQKSVMGKFFYALALSDLLIGDVKVKKNERSALDIFDELIELDEKNVAIYIFKAVVQMNMKDEAGARSTLSEIKMRGANHYNGYNTSFTKNLLIDSADNLSDYMGAIGLNSTLPVPKLQAFYSLQEKLKINMEPLGHMLVKDGMRTNGEYMEILWMPYEYSVGYSLLNKDRDNPQWQIPTLKELIENHNNSSAYWDFFAVLKSPKDCNLKTLSEWLGNYQEKMKIDLSRLDR